MNSEIVEINVPRKLAYLSKLYEWLRNELDVQTAKARFTGFSLYEVSGAYHGERVYTEQTLVVRLVFGRHPDEFRDDADRLSHLAMLNGIAQEISEITHHEEEEIWLIRIPADRIVRKNQGVIHAPAW